MAKAKQPVTINDIEFDALIDEVRTLEATVPEYSVEKGYCVSDAIILTPEKLAMTLFVTSTPVTWYSRHGNDPNRVKEVINKLEEMYFAKEPVTIVTSEATYTNMAIESLTISKTFDVGYAREIPIAFKKIEVTKIATTTIPDSYGKSGATGANGGTANTGEGDSGGSGGSGNSGDSSSGGDDGGSDGSILWNIANSVGLIP